MITDTQYLEKLEKWDMVMALMGFGSEERMLDEWESESGEDFMEKVEEYERFMDELAEPSPLMAAIMRGYEMGIRFNDMREYEDHLEEIEERRIREQQAEEDRTHTVFVTLDRKHKYTSYQSKRYENHHCFEFDTKGVRVYGEIWVRAYHDVHLRLSWTGKDKKKRKQSFKGTWWTFTVPHEFPQHWNPGNNTSNVERIAKIVAYCMSKGTKKAMTYISKPIELPE